MLINLIVISLIVLVTIRIIGAWRSAGFSFRSLSKSVGWSLRLLVGWLANGVRLMWLGLYIYVASLVTHNWNSMDNTLKGWVVFFGGWIILGVLINLNDYKKNA